MALTLRQFASPKLSISFLWLLSIDLGIFVIFFYFYFSIPPLLISLSAVVRLNTFYVMEFYFFVSRLFPSGSYFLVNKNKNERDYFNINKNKKAENENEGTKKFSWYCKSTPSYIFILDLRTYMHIHTQIECGKISDKRVACLCFSRVFVCICVVILVHVCMHKNVFTSSSLFLLVSVFALFLILVCISYILLHVKQFFFILSILLECIFLIFLLCFLLLSCFCWMVN